MLDTLNEDIDNSKEILNTVIPLTADLKDADGVCNHMSVTFEYEAIPAFYYEESGGAAQTTGPPADPRPGRPGRRGRGLRRFPRRVRATPDGSTPATAWTPARPTSCVR